MKFFMRKTTRVAALSSALLLLLGYGHAQQPPAPAPSPAPQQKPQEPPTIRTNVSLVNVIATVTDRRHHFVTDLGKTDFKILEDGKPQDITNFFRQTDLPLRIAVLLDTSNSIRERLRFEKEAATDFLYKTVRRSKDLAFLMTFDNEPEVIQDYTEDLDQLRSAIEAQRAGGGTAFRDAIYAASAKLITAPVPAGPNPEVRRVLVVISDGDDNLSDHALSESLEMAEKSEAAIYAISTNTDWLSLSHQTPEKIMKSHGDKILEQFADDTGGRVFFPYRIDDLAQSFQDIGNELRSQYSVAYIPSNPVSRGGFRRIEVKVDRKGLIVRSRRGYFAPRPVTQAAQTGAAPTRK
jgi:Ca-activated chloride channel family protein